MTRNHIIAKAMLTTLGIYAVVAFVSVLRPIQHTDNYIQLVLSGSLIAVLTVFIIRLLVFKNDSLASKIIGAKEDVEEFDQRTYLIKTFRVAFVILGLLLLCSSSILRTLKLLHAVSLPNIREWISQIINTKEFRTPKFTTAYIVDFIKLLAAGYLLCGGSYIIRWHLKHSSIQKTEGLQDE